MTDPLLDEERIKELFKQALVEILEERKDLFYDLFTEIIEDTAFINAIREGQDTETVSRKDIFDILDGGS